MTYPPSFTRTPDQEWRDSILAPTPFVLLAAKDSAAVKAEFRRQGLAGLADLMAHTRARD